MDYSFLGKQVPVGSVEKELRLLWELDEASTKASLMNFVIYSEAGDSLEKNSKAVAEITRENACRAILMDLDRSGKEPKIRAWITAHCNLAGGKKSVCCEQVAFKLDGYTPGIVRYTLFSHLDSDLPLVIWWQGEFSESFRESFYSKVDRLLFDSGEWQDPAGQFAILTRALEEENTLVVQDLAWTRTYPFRLAIAALVDQPCVINRLDQVKSVRVKSSAACRTASLQMLAWFARLSHYQISSCSAADSTDSFIALMPKGNEVELSASYDEKYASIGEVEIDMGDCIVRVENEFDRPLLHQKVFLDGEKVVSSHCPADSDHAVGLIISQLSRGGKNSLFKKVLPYFLEMLKKLDSGK